MWVAKLSMAHHLALRRRRTVIPVIELTLREAWNASCKRGGWRHTAKTRGGNLMAAQKKSSRSGKAKSKVHKVMKEHKEGTLRSGSGKKVKSRKQAVAIALNEARESGAKVPKKKKSR